MKRFLNGLLIIAYQSTIYNNLIDRYVCNWFLITKRILFIGAEINNLKWLVGSSLSTSSTVPRTVLYRNCFQPNSLNVWYNICVFLSRILCTLQTNVCFYQITEDVTYRPVHMTLLYPTFSHLLGWTLMESRCQQRHCIEKVILFFPINTT